jgi:hypothetical protein
MRHLAFVSIAALVVLGLLAATATAAPPVVAAPKAIDLQGVSALLEGEVNPQGLATSYRFEYLTQAAFATGGFAAATRTALTPVGSGTDPRPARAAVAGLAPATAYRFRLFASNSSGSASAEGSFTTTQGFGFLSGAAGFSVRASADGGAATMAGSHPYQLDLDVGLRAGGEFENQPGARFPDGDLRNLEFSLPPGLILNSSVLGQCTPARFTAPRSSPFEDSAAGENCPDASQVGTIELSTALAGEEPRRFGLFSLTPPPGAVAELGAAPYGAPILFDLVFGGGEGGAPYSLALRAHDVPQRFDISGLSLALWGTPWAASHNGERGDCLNETEPTFPWAKCSVGPPSGFPPAAYVSLPARCSGPLGFTATATSWQQPGTSSAGAENLGASGPAELGACGALSFKPAPVGLLTDKKASSPSGYNFRLSSEDEGLTLPGFAMAPQVRKLKLALPDGVTVNPSVGAGLGTCAPGQYAAETVLTPTGAGCPDDSKIGAFAVHSPLFPEAVGGSVFLATPNENPFGSLIAVYLVAKLPSRGVEIKLAGQIVPDPRTGNLVAEFDGLPQLPYTDLDLSFDAGQRAFLITPPACGEATSRIELTSWAEDLPPRSFESSSAIETGVGAEPCPQGPPQFAPRAVSGAVNSNVGSYTPYFIHLGRSDKEQEITSYSLVLPKGVTGKLAGIPPCPDAAIAAARGRSGVAETAEPSCPAASLVGHTNSGYGVGSALTYAPGRIYLAGPYHGAPLSLVTINPATVGPFDLGTIVVRSAFQIDPLTAQLRIDSRGSDPIPHILDGIPLHLREVRIYIDRPDFTHNPSSCEPSQMESTLTGSGATFADPADDSTASATSRFQLLNCLTLGFRPKMGLRLRGGSRRGAYPELRATFASRGPRDSNLKRIDVTMPHAEFLAQNHIREICTRPQFEAESCPAGSVYGHAVAYTPLLDAPLRGNVYLRSSSHRLPDLVASLRSGSIRIVLEGKIGPAKQGIRTSFDHLPDAPIKRFVLTLNGGKRGLLVNSADICASPPPATVRALGQNDIGSSFTTTLRGQCGRRGGAKKKNGKRRHEKGAKR